MDTFKKIVKEYSIYVILIIVVLLVKTYIVSPIVVNGDSMFSTLHNGDIMILNKLKYKTSDIKRFDIVVVKYNSKYIIKRVIGMPGDTVEYIDNILYINGKEYTEDYLDKGTITKKDGEDFKIEKIDKGYYFVLGDNREVSLDSRSIGLVKESDINGYASLTLFPFSRFGEKN